MLCLTSCHIAGRQICLHNHIHYESWERRSACIYSRNADMYWYIFHYKDTSYLISYCRESEILQCQWGLQQIWNFHVQPIAFGVSLFNLKSQSMIWVSSSLLPRFNGQRPVRLRLNDTPNSTCCTLRLLSRCSHPNTHPMLWYILIHILYFEWSNYPTLYLITHTKLESRAGDVYICIYTHTNTHI